MRILIAEDDQKLLKSLIYIFEHNRFNVDGVSSGDEALAIGFSQLSVTEFFVFRKMESHETESHLLCGWSSKCL